MHPIGNETCFKFRLIQTAALLLVLMTAMANAQWTRNTTGCKCYFDGQSTECACCNTGGCQCPRGKLHQCVECGHTEQCGTLMSNYQWTQNTSGCQCYFDDDSTDCACCFAGGCQCSQKYRHQCVQCGFGDQCGKAMPNYPWTRNSTGCQCYFDTRSTDCACCHPGGGQCWQDHRNQCVQQGFGEHCGIELMLDYQWTRNTTGCKCFFETESTDCACCYPGGCQCSMKHRHQCHQCGHSEECEKVMPNYQWTRNSTGCKCYFNESSTDCACCIPGGCQCPWYNPHQCVQCGHGEQCYASTENDDTNIGVLPYWEQLLNYKNDNTEDVVLSFTYETGIKDSQGDTKTNVDTHSASVNIGIKFLKIVDIKLSYTYSHETTTSHMSQNEIYETQTIETTVTIPPRSTLARWQLFVDVAGVNIGCSYYIDVINDTDSTPTSHKITGTAKLQLIDG